MRALGIVLVACCAVWFVLAAAHFYFSIPSAEAASNQQKYSLEEANCIILVDRETGMQYIKTYHGGITPRLGKDGKPFVEAGK